MCLSLSPELSRESSNCRYHCRHLMQASMLVLPVFPHTHTMARFPALETGTVDSFPTSWYSLDAHHPLLKECWSSRSFLHGNLLVCDLMRTVRSLLSSLCRNNSLVLDVTGVLT